MSSKLGVVLLLAVCVWVLRIISRGLTGPLSKVPGPWYLRFTALPLKLATIKGRQIYFIEALHQKYGDTVVVAPNQLDTRDPYMFREVHRHGNGFRKSNWYKLFAGYYDANEGNYSLFLLTDPKLHAIRRKLMARAFSKSEIRKNWEKEIKRKVEFAVTRMQQDASADSNREVDVQKWWVLMAADVSSMITFGESFNSLQAGEKDIFLEAIERIGKINGICAEFPILNALKNVPLPFVRKFFSIQSNAMEFANRTVENSRKHGTTGAGNIFTGILAEAEKSESHLSGAVLTREARSLIIAGTDTTAISLTFLVWCVLSRPRLHQDILEELREAKQARNASGDDGVGEELSDEQLEQLPILNAAISETLRLYGAAPGALPRIPVQGGVTIGGLYVPDSVTVSTQAWSLHRHPGLWENPEDFDVQRWLGSAEMPEATKISFNPFGAGGRVCLGRHIADMELRYAAAMFFTRYPEAKLAPSTNSDTMRPEYFFTIFPRTRQCRVKLC